jgi:hypothetical protein
MLPCQGDVSEDLDRDSNRRWESRRCQARRREQRKQVQHPPVMIERAPLSRAEDEHKARA